MRRPDRAGRRYILFAAEMDRFKKFMDDVRFNSSRWARPFYCDYNPIPEKKKHGK